MPRRLLHCCALSIATALAPTHVWAQDTLYFSTSDPGVTKSIERWGVDTAWPSPDNMRHAIEHMGADRIDVVRVNFYIHEPLTAEGNLRLATRTRLDTQLELASMPGNKPIALTPNSGDTTDPWYLNGNQIRVDRWAQVINATREYVEQQGKTVVEVEPFNEPDFWPGQGTPQNLKGVMDTLKADPAFAHIAMVGASTLNSDNAAGWYNTVSGPTSYGSTHQLGGSTDSYVSFIQHVKAAGDTPYNPEIHSIGEVLYGAEYGLEGGIWWGAAMVSRGLVVKAVEGKRLGYAENRGDGTAAAVYRAPDGAIRAFAGGFERDYQGTPTTYRIVSTDRDVYFNGVGPLREYMVHAGQNTQGSYVDIQHDIPSTPALDGYRWRIVNRVTGDVLQVPDSGLTDGADIRTAPDTGAAHQRWDIVRELDGYYKLTAVHSGRTAEVADWLLDDGANVRQWGMGDNILQHWFIEHVADGYYYLRNGHSNKFMTAGAGGAVYQSVPTRNRLAQQWEFQLANPNAAEVLSAHYEFENNAQDSAGSNHAVLSGGPTYTSGPLGQALHLDGANDYATLPAGIADSDDITIAAWVRWEGGAPWQRVFDFGDDTTSHLFLTPSSGDGTMRLAITTDGGTGEQFLDTDPLPTDEWVHLAVTLGGNTGVLYVNGAPRVAGQILLNPSDFNPANNYIGKSQYADPLFAGQIDDFRVYDDALAPNQIASLIRAGDFNDDGVVDAADYAQWRDGLGTIYTAADYESWRQNYGATYGADLPTLQSASVPEPAGGIIAATVLGFSRRRLVTTA